jgi:hypothetical protein
VTDIVIVIDANSIKHPFVRLEPALKERSAIHTILAWDRCTPKRTDNGQR